MLWPELDSPAESDWDAYERRTARPNSLLTDENAKRRETEEVVIEPPSRRSRSSEVES